MVQMTRERRTSYQDKLAGIIPSAFEEAFRTDDYQDDETDDDIGPKEEDGIPRLLLTRKEKLQIRALWRNSLIVKSVGRTLEFRGFQRRLHDLWRPIGGMEVVDIGNGFSTVTFHNGGEDRAKILWEGPWFIDCRFLSIRVGSQILISG